MSNRFLNFILLFLLVSIQVIGQKQIVLVNKVLTIKINTLGAELQNITNTLTGTEYLWQGDSIYWRDRAPLMFPVNVRFKDDRFTYKGSVYEMPKMGIAKISEFELKKVTSSKVELILNSNSEILRYYPFPFQLKVVYALKKNRLVNQFTVKNTGKDTMYFALGGHPGFHLSITNNGRKDYQYTFSEKLIKPRTEIRNSILQQNEIPFLENENILNLDDHRIPGSGMFLKDISAREIGVGMKGENPFIQINLGNFPNVNIWSPPGAPFACIEPMVSHHDVENSSELITKKKFLTELAPNKSLTYYFTISINR